MRTRLGAAVVGIGVAAVLALGACGGDDGGSSGDGDDDATGTSEAATDAADGSPTCDLLATERVSELFGHEATVLAPDAGAAEVAGSCTWQAEAAGDDSPAVYQLQLSVYPGGAFYDATAWGGTPEPVSGLGDEAFVVRDGGAQGTTAGYRDAARSVFLTYAVLVDPDAPGPSGQADAVVSLLRDVDAALG
ncbi:MAG TPA: hypothetical protein VFI47_13485 [Acidimicrobiales bacterium]|nr:hypothetical protein [Acidimicrobiales bacterium]